MHDAAYQWMLRTVSMMNPPRRVCEFGSLNVNGSARELFGSAERYLGLDVREGPGVDLVADAATWRSDERFDCIVCMETLEHAREGEAICRNAHAHLSPGGILLLTAAAPPRRPHGPDGHPLKAGEFYRNVTEGLLRHWLDPFQAVMIDAFTVPGDIYALAVRT